MTPAAHLKKLLPAAVRDIRRRVLKRRLNPLVPALDIELHFDGRATRFLAYEMDGHGNQFTVEKDGKIYGGGFFPALSKALRFGRDVEFEELEAPLIRWFRKAWAQAGGARFRLPTKLRVHDDIAEYVLSKGSPVSSRRER